MNEDLILKLNSIFTSYIGALSQGTGDVLLVKDIRDTLDKIFTGTTCAEVIYTENTDKLFFGAYVSPTILADDFTTILFGSEDYVVHRYTLEIDSKLFSVGMDADEITAYILYEVAAMVSDSAPVWEVRKEIDYHLANEDDVINIKQSINYSQVLILAIKDALVKMSSIRYKDTDGILSNEFINDNDLRDSLINGVNKVRSSVFGIGTGVEEPKLVMLEWAFNIYKDAKLNANTAIDTLTQAKNFTAIKLLIKEYDKTIDSLKRLKFEIANEGANILNEAKKGLLAGLKKSGIRGIEDDLYEFSIRAKNAETEEEAYYALRQINTRLNILEEYIDENENELPEREVQRLRDLSMQYRNLREVIAQKKMHKKSYGLWYDYSKLDELD